MAVEAHPVEEEVVMVCKPVHVVVEEAAVAVQRICPEDLARIGPVAAEEVVRMQARLAEVVAELNRHSDLLAMGEVAAHSRQVQQGAGEEGEVLQRQN